MENTETIQEETQAVETTEDATVIIPTEEGQETTEATGAVEEQEPEEVPAWADKRFKKLARQKHDARSAAEQSAREAEYWKNKAQGKQEAPTVATETAKPTREQFDFDDEKYIDALTDWKIEARETQSQAQRTAKQKEEDDFNNLQSFEQKRDATVNRGREKHEDFDDVVFSLSPDIMNQEMANAVFETESPEDISYYLGNNPEVAERISKLSPIKKAIELGKIEGVMATTTKKTTTAPPPIKPVGASGVTEKTPATMSNSEYREWSRKNRRA